MYHENVIAGQGYESHSFGLFAPQAIILDNDYESVKPYRNHLTSNGISTLLTSKTTIAKDAFMQQGNTAAYIFDMHMRNIHKVGSRDTGRGLAVGVTLVSDITNDGRSNNIKHCATLTEHRTEPSAKISYGVLEKNGQLITRLSKNEKFDEFVEFINIYKNDYLNNIKKIWF